MTQQDAKKVWKSITIAIAIQAIAAIATTMITLKVVTATQDKDIQFNRENILDIKQNYVPRSEIQNTQSWMVGEINENRQNCEELRNTVSDNYREIHSELNDIKKILMQKK
jgi:hypothetical protein